MQSTVPGEAKQFSTLSSQAALKPYFWLWNHSAWHYESYY